MPYKELISELFTDLIANNIPAEIKILGASVFGSVVFDIEMFWRFIIPLSSYLSWWLLKPVLDRRRRKRKKQEKDEDSNSKSS